MDEKENIMNELKENKDETKIDKLIEKLNEMENSISNECSEENRGIINNYFNNDDGVDGYSQIKMWNVSWLLKNHLMSQLQKKW